MDLFSNGFTLFRRLCYTVAMLQEKFLKSDI